MLDFREGRYGEVRILRLLRSSQRPMSRRRAHRFLKIDNLSAGLATRPRPGLIRVPAPQPLSGGTQALRSEPRSAPCGWSGKMHTNAL